MSDYIEREAAIEAAKKSHFYFDLKPIIKSISAADVRPVVRATNKSKSGFLCSACSFGDFGGFNGYKPNFCPNCGADLREERADKLKRYNKEVEHLPPYIWMANEATRNLPVYGTTIVAMRINGIRFNEILDYDAAYNCWSWVSDWYEGQTDIEFIGAIPLSEVQVNEAISE